MKTLIGALLWLSLFGAVFGGAVRAEDLLGRQETALKGAPSVYLDLQVVLPHSIRYAVNAEALRERIAASLLRRGVKMTAGIEHAAKKEGILEVRLTAEQSRSPELVVFAAAAEFSEIVLLPRSGEKVRGVTWRQSYAGDCSTAQTTPLEEVVLSLVDAFARGYQIVNR